MAPDCAVSESVLCVAILQSCTKTNTWRKPQEAHKDVVYKSAASPCRKKYNVPQQTGGALVAARRQKCVLEWQQAGRNVYLSGSKQAEMYT